VPHRVEGETLSGQGLARKVGGEESSEREPESINSRQHLLMLGITFRPENGEGGIHKLSLGFLQGAF
jgi:hypothetical protein